MPRAKYFPLLRVRWSLAFKTQNLREVIETVYRLTSHAEQVRVPEGGMRIAIGVSMGEVELENDIDPNAAMTGSAIDSSQILANLAQAGEIVVDTRSRQATSQTFVFERSINTESIAMRGEVLDRERPFRSDCAQEIGLFANTKPDKRSVHRTKRSHNRKKRQIYTPRYCGWPPWQWNIQSIRVVANTSQPRCLL